MRQEHVAGVAELGDARDLKSCGPLAYAGSTPAPGTTYSRLISSKRFSWS
jgi:hypothetical protein